MKVAIRLKGEKFRKLEKPKVFGNCHTFKSTATQSKCGHPQYSLRSKVHVVTIPFLPAHLRSEPCKPCEFNEVIPGKIVKNQCCNTCLK